MTNFKKQLLSVVATGAVLLNAVAPVFATDGTSVVISGNGADSENEAELRFTTTTTVVQNNDANVTNKIYSDSNTGGNSASRNTGGDVLVDTGDADSRVTINNLLNKNSAIVACCDDRGVSVLIEGNGAGDGRGDSENEVELKLKNETGVYQDNTATVYNKVEADADTGDNRAGRNTGGDVTISTGDSDTRVAVSTTANSNTAKVGGSGGNGGGISAMILDNGADSENEIEMKLKLETAVYQDNNADVKNKIDADADTGDNKASRNTGGDVEVDTGAALAVVGVDNTLNFNWAELDCCILGGTITAKIAGNGADSENEIELKLRKNATVTQDNEAKVKNLVWADANTGDNRANRNTGGNVSIDTGDADVLVAVDNLLNFNFADIECCFTGLEAKILDNGADSENEIEVKRYNENGTWQDNLAYLKNKLWGDADTGNNKVKENTGGEHEGDPSVETGNSYSTVGASNVGNVNQVGGPFDLPDVEVEFDMQGLWILLSYVFAH